MSEVVPGQDLVIEGPVAMAGAAAPPPGQSQEVPQELVEVKLGKKPARRDPRDLLYAAYRRPRGLAVPASAHWGRDLPYAILGNSQYGDCITPDMRVLTADLRWVPAGDLRPGDKLIGFDEESRKNYGRGYRLSYVETASIVRRSCVELEFEDGTVVRCSEGHRWLATVVEQRRLSSQVWRKASDLAVGSRGGATKAIKSFEPWSTDNSFEAGYLAAAFDGEGHLDQSLHTPRPNGTLKQSNRICFSQADNSMLAEVKRCMKELGFEYQVYVQERGGNSGADGATRQAIHRVSICRRSDWLRFAGTVRPGRLLGKLDIDCLGRIEGRRVRLVRKTFIGEQDVVFLNTTSRTYFAEGLASHNCVEAAAQHYLQVVWDRASGSATEYVPTTDATLADYSAITGFNLADPATDQGTDMHSACAYWRSTGIGASAAKYKIAAYLSVAPDNEVHAREAVEYYGGLYVGLAMPLSAQAQTFNGLWDVTTGPDSVPGSWGGHCVIVTGYDSEGLWCVTWGRLQKMDWSFFGTYCDEAYILLAPEWLKSTGYSPSGLQWGQLLTGLNSL